MTLHELTANLVKEFGTRDLNEANTRHQIIDRLFHEALAWPHGNVKCEEHVHPGYIDYVLRDHARRAVLLTETKREDVYFRLPTKVGKSGNGVRLIHLRTLATDSQIANAVNQAAKYCPAIGCQYACITNGHEFIIFRSFIPGKDFLDADALVIPELSFFSDFFTEAYNLLGFEALTSNRSLQLALGSGNSIARLAFLC